MSVDFTHQVEIQRPADEVFAYLADFENNPDWQGGMVACRWTSEARG
ncbi:MAG: SRPBCC family protein, partial [Alphaproteobacteria bacterium]|nr:SRPBCC family protein [Alphaproteobacteria bacterium]